MSKDFIIKILVNEIKKRDWKFLFNNFNIICFKKIISINKFDLKISLIDENKLVIKNSLYTSKGVSGAKLCKMLTALPKTDNLGDRSL